MRRQRSCTHTNGHSSVRRYHHSEGGREHRLRDAGGRCVRRLGEAALPSRRVARDAIDAWLELDDEVRGGLEIMGQLSDLDREALVAAFWEESASARGATLR